MQERRVQLLGHISIYALLACTLRIWEGRGKEDGGGALLRSPPSSSLPPYKYTGGGKRINAISPFPACGRPCRAVVEVIWDQGRWWGERPTFAGVQCDDHFFGGGQTAANIFMSDSFRENHLEKTTRKSLQGKHHSNPIISKDFVC